MKLSGERKSKESLNVGLLVILSNVITFASLRYHRKLKQRDRFRKHFDDHFSIDRWKLSSAVMYACSELVSSKTNVSSDVEEK